MSGFDLIIIPDEEDAEAAGVFVDGVIGGRPYRFLLDTGAARTTIAFDGDTSALIPTGQSRSSGVFAGSSDALVIVPSIGIGPIVRKDFTVPRLATERTTKGLIGMDMLKDHRCHFFFDQNFVSVDADDWPEDTLDLQELYLDRTFHPYVDVRFGEVTARTVWDTGAGITIADTGFIDKHPASFQEAGRSHGTDSAGVTVETPMFLMASSVIGGCVFAPHRVAGVDLSQANATLEVPMDLILGYSTLSQANWWFDFPRRRWAISKMLGTTTVRLATAHLG